MIPLDPAFAEQRWRFIPYYLPLPLFWVSQEDAGAARKPENPSGSEQAPSRGIFLPFSGYAGVSGRRPMAALPRRTIYNRASCRVCGIVTKRNLFPAALAKCLVDSDTIAAKRLAAYQAWATIQQRNTKAMKNTHAGPGHGGGTPPTRIRLRIRGKGRINRAGKLVFPIGFPAFSGCPGAV